MAESKKTDFETALKELEKIADQLENGDTSLEEAIKLYEKGIAFSKICSDALNSAKQKIITLDDASSEEN